MRHIGEKPETTSPGDPSAALIVDMRFAVHYQPIVALADRRTVAHEALLRCDGGPPVEVIAGAEACDDTLDLDRWVIRHALAEASSLPGALHVNVSACSAQLYTDGLLACLSKTLRRERVDPGRIVVEVTETYPIRDIEAIAAFADQLHELGAKICADDVGIGSIADEHLDAVAWDVSKLPSELISARGAPAKTRVGELLGQIRRRGIVSVVEGVRSEAAARRLAAAGAELGQAYLFGRPAPLAEQLRRAG